ncbi:hypothetical protein KRP22_001462 [Phytophthora ramorum]|nr:hypothetical protein KRP22_7129 [Phytophthora ramorum]
MQTCPCSEPIITRERIVATLVATKTALARLNMEPARTDKMSVFDRKALLQEQDAVHERYQVLGAEWTGRERSVFENAVVEGEVKTTELFCSQLVAGLYQHLGFLLPYPSANSYLHKHFSGPGCGDFLTLQQRATFLSEISLRQELEKETKRFGRVCR